MSFWLKVHCFSFFWFILMSAWSHAIPFLNPQLKRNAYRLFAEGHFDDAISIYHQMVHPYSPRNQEIILQLASCYLENFQAQETIDLLQSISLNLNYQSDRIYLLSQAYRKLHCPEKALEILDSLNLKSPIRFEQAIHFEKGLDYFTLKQFDLAKINFQTILMDPASPALYFLSQIYLAKIAILENDLHLARSILKMIQLPQKHPVAHEKVYLTGLILFLSNNYQSAIEKFEKANTLYQNLSNTSNQSLRRILISSYLLQASKHINQPKQVNTLLQRAEKLAKIPDSDKEIDYLLLGDIYLLKGRLLNDKSAFSAAINLFSDSQCFSTNQTKFLADLKLAETFETYSSKKSYYHNLLKKYPANENQVDILYHFGLSILKHSLQVLNENFEKNPSISFFDEARQIFEKAYILSLSTHHDAYTLLRGYTVAALFDHSNDHLKQSGLFLENELKNQSGLLDHQQYHELSFLIAMIWKRQAHCDYEAMKKAEKILNELIAQPSCLRKEVVKSLSTLYMQQEKWDEAERLLNDWSSKIKKEDLDISLLQAYCAEKLNQSEKKQTILKHIYSEYPLSAQAPTAYFYYYTYREYLKGHRKAIRHLQSMFDIVPNHPLLILAHHLIGLDCLKDHLSEDGTVLRRKDLIGAIDAFQKSEAAFDHSCEKKEIPLNLLPTMVQACFQSTREKALANIAIADSSYGTKRQIYLEYAEDVLSKLVDRIINSKHIINNHFQQNLLGESYYWMAMTKIKKNQFSAANHFLDLALEIYESANHSHGYLLSRIWYEKGKLCQIHNQHSQAILSFQLAEKTGLRQPCLSPDQKMDLWIDKSISYRELGDLENAMKLLSKVINEEEISSLRVKAMYLRSELYELQGRPELALKQLEAAAKKGGEWSRKAKERLDAYGIYAKSLN